MNDPVPALISEDAIAPYRIYAEIIRSFLADPKKGRQEEIERMMAKDAVPYTTCDYTQEDCRKRGMFGGIKK